MRNVAEIGDSIVQPVSVDVIDLTGRPCPVVHEPSEPMHFDLLSVDSELSVAMLDRPSNRALSGFPLRNLPSENVGLAVVGKQMVGSFDGQ